MSSLSVRAAAGENPDGLALVTDDEGKWSWRELAAEVDRVPRRPEPAGARSFLPLVATPTPETVFRILAALDREEPLALLDPGLPERELLLRRRLLAEAAAVRQAPPAGAPLAVLFTSGSTGAPRGVELSRAAFLASAAASERRLGWRAGDRWLCVLPLAHVGGLSILTRCLIARRTLVLAGEFDPERLGRLIERESVTMVSLVPTMLARLLDSDSSRTRLKSLRVVLVGGAPASPRLWTEAIGRGLPVLETWGMTETCSQVATAIPGGDPRAPVPLDGWQVRSRDGRLEVRGEALLTGYLGGAGPGSPLDDDGWFRTGDAGRVNDDGSVTILGRADEMIVTGGKKVFPAEVERFLESLPQVRRAVVLGIADETWGEVVVAALEPDSAHPGRAADRDSVLAPALREGLATWQRPRAIVWVERFPETSSGKVDRAGIREQFLAGLTSRHPTP
jgi:O-succinylbenzoic acid--CoA ligase